MERWTGSHRVGPAPWLPSVESGCPGLQAHNGKRSERTEANMLAHRLVVVFGDGSV